MTRREEIKERKNEIGFDEGPIEAEWFESGALWADEHPDREKLFNALSKTFPAFNEVWICALVETIIKHWNDE